MLGLRRRRHPNAAREGEAVRDERVRDERVRDEPVRDERRERRGYGRNTVRGVFTLIGVAAAGFLLWLASYLNLDSTGEFWGAMGLVAGAGLALVLSQVFGGWTKWGRPKISLAVLLLGWVPAAVATGWILLTVQPENGWQQARLESWSDSIGILDLVQDIGVFQAAVALALGAVTGFVFDTTGPRVRSHERGREREAGVPDEDVHDYERRDDDGRDAETTATTAPPTTTTGRTAVRDRDGS